MVSYSTHLTISWCIMYGVNVGGKTYEPRLTCSGLWWWQNIGDAWFLRTSMCTKYLNTLNLHASTLGGNHVSQHAAQCSILSPSAKKQQEAKPTSHRDPHWTTLLQIIEAEFLHPSTFAGTHVDHHPVSKRIATRAKSQVHARFTCCLNSVSPERDVTCQVQLPSVWMVSIAKLLITSKINHKDLTANFINHKPHHKESFHIEMPLSAMNNLWVVVVIDSGLRIEMQQRSKTVWNHEPRIMQLQLSHLGYQQHPRNTGQKWLTQPQPNEKGIPGKAYGFLWCNWITTKMPININTIRNVCKTSPVVLVKTHTYTFACHLNARHLNEGKPVNRKP